MIKVIVDDKISFIRGVLESVAGVEYLPGAEISNAQLKDTDALIIRTRTKCNTQLLENTPVKFIATATIGFDHIDVDYCKEKNIEWTNAPGCNAGSVAQYIASVLANISIDRQISLFGKTLGIVGVGNVGSRIISIAEILGMQVLLNDPPRQRAEKNSGFVALETIKSKSDFITFHVPLNYSGVDKTYHMVNDSFLKTCKSNVIIINSSRGEVINNNHLKQALSNKTIDGAVLDVWENEPNIDLELMQKLIFATPHIAGYSADGKANSTAMSVQALSRFFDLDLSNWYPQDVPVPDNSQIELYEEFLVFHAIARSINQSYNIKNDHKRLLENPEDFEKQRGDYPLRREFVSFKVNSQGTSRTELEILNKLGFKINTLS